MSAQPFSLRLRSGPLTIHLYTRIDTLSRLLRRMYGAAALDSPAQFADFHIGMARPRGPRRWLRPQVCFTLDAQSPFEPYPLEHALPLFEWGLNWCIGTTFPRQLMLHAGALEKNGFGLLLPATPGAGKSTLTAALCHRGWRLLSDEFGIVRHDDGQLLPMPRAIGLKNRSIAVIRDFAPDAFFGPVYPGTRKGDVAHLAPPAESLARQAEPATPRWVVFPRYAPGAQLQLKAEPPSVSFTRLANNAFNYQISGAQGFRTLVHLTESAMAYSLAYSKLDEAVAQMDRLAEGAQP